MEKIQKLINVEASFFDKNSEWIIQICIILFLTWVASAILQRIVRKIAAKAIEGEDSWKHIFVSALFSPLRVFVWVGGITIALSVLHDGFPIPIIKSLLGFQPVIHTLIVGWFFLRVIHSAFDYAAVQYEKLTQSTADMLEKISSIVVFAIMVLLILPSFGISISGLLAFGGIGGIVVGLAAKDILANMFSSMMLHFDSPFAIGDVVSLPEKDLMGVVEDIGWRQVQLRTFDKQLVFIPNFMFGDLILVNPSKMTNRRIYEIIGVRYDDMKKVPKIVEEIRAYLLQHKDLDQEAGVTVHLEKFAASSVDILICIFTKDTDWGKFLAVKEQVLLKVSDIIDDNSAEIAFPTQVVQIENSSS